LNQRPLGYELCRCVLSIRYFDGAPVQIATQSGIARNPDATGDQLEVRNLDWSSCLLISPAPPSPLFCRVSSSRDPFAGPGVSTTMWRLRERSRGIRQRDRELAGRQGALSDWPNGVSVGSEDSARLAPTRKGQPDPEPELGPCDLDWLRKIGVIRDEKGDVDATFEGVAAADRWPGSRPSPFHPCGLLGQNLGPPRVG
jgi:hypothetical protein